MFKKVEKLENIAFGVTHFPPPPKKKKKTVMKCEPCVVRDFN